MTVINESELLAGKLNLSAKNIKTAIELLDEGNTVPFIARYRKDRTGGIDDEQLREVEHELKSMRELEERREDILRLIRETGRSTPQIEQTIKNAITKTELEDIYRPFRPKRRTRASIAREQGLEPLKVILVQRNIGKDKFLLKAAEFVDPEKDLPDICACVGGACDILAEELSDDPSLRQKLRSKLWREGQIVSSAKKAKAGKDPKKREKEGTYKSYEDWRMPVDKVKGHQVLALNRGEKEGFLSVKIEAEDDGFVRIIRDRLSRDTELGQLLDETSLDSWKRLIFPSLETEIRNGLTEEAQDQAIEIFAKNLKNTLLAPPLRGKTVLALDPGYVNGCKLAVTASDGKVIETAHIYPVKPREDIDGSVRILDRIVEKHGVEVLALGNGTATRETEDFIQKWKEISGIKLPLIIVNEAGASVYSASAIAKKEFPDMDVSLRSAVSLARRLQDPLAELVKIDPDAIGVGQYQHDMDQKRLGERLGEVVEDCVNEVGVDLNTASVSLLSYISGISPVLAKNIYEFREKNGPFKNREELNSVPRLGPKAFEQCAGFLRIRNGSQMLDNTSVHPESYEIARALLEKLGIENWSGNEDVLKKAESMGIEKLAEELNAGTSTLKDIAAALDKPGRDGRTEREIVERSSEISDISDLRPGMQLPGVVRNVAAFGAFVDIGVHQDGLVHISEMADRFVSDPSTIVQAGQIVKVTVLSVEKDRNRISLSMKTQRDKPKE